MIFLEISEPFTALVIPASLERAAQAALAHQSAPGNAGLTIVITDDDQLQDLNRQYLGIDAPTDVLSFPAGYTDPDTGAGYLGDVLISYPQAQAQVAASGHQVAEELQLLVVHGVLHLLGHDHLEAAETARMWAAQAEILAALDLAHVQLPE
jgi:probable rRNA maturation factor